MKVSKRGLKMFIKLQSYRTDSTGRFVGFHGSEIGLMVWILHFKLWGRISVNGRLCSKNWWKARLDRFINAPTVHIANPQDGCPAEPVPVPFEIEMGMPNLDHAMLLKAYNRLQVRGLINVSPVID